MRDGGRSLLRINVEVRRHHPPARALRVLESGVRTMAGYQLEGRAPVPVFQDASRFPLQLRPSGETGGKLALAS